MGEVGSWEQTPRWIRVEAAKREARLGRPAAEVAAERPLHQSCLEPARLQPVAADPSFKLFLIVLSEEQAGLGVLGLDLVEVV
jgi:hypothetical protein